MIIPERVPGVLRVLGAAGVVCATVALLNGEEGVKLHAYYDIAGVPTICAGETRGVQIEDRATREQCDVLLTASAKEFLGYVDGYFKPKVLPDATRVGLASFCYNEGKKACYSSQAFRLLKDDKYYGGCYALRDWARAAGDKYKLIDRRDREVKLCLIGFEQAGLL